MCTGNEVFLNGFENYAKSLVVDLEIRLVFYVYNKINCIALGITTTITAGMALTTITTITTADSGMAICGAVAVVTFIVAAATMAHETTIRV